MQYKYSRIQNALEQQTIVVEKDDLRIFYDPSTYARLNEAPYQDRFERLGVKSSYAVIEKKTYEHILTPENALKVAAFEIKRHLPSTQLTGKVLRVEENSVLLSVGSVHCIRPNLKLKIIRMGEAVVDPDTKKVLGNDVHEIARVQVTEVQPEFCRAKLIPAKPEDAERKRPPLQVGDLVKFDTSAGAVAMLIPSDVDGKLEEALTKELLHFKIPLVERTLLQRGMQELQQPAGDKTMQEIYRDFGKQTGASFIVGGTVIGEQIVNQPRRPPLGDQIVNQPRRPTFEGIVDVQLRLIDIESGEIITVFSGKHKVD